METLRIYASMPVLGIWWKSYVFMLQCLFRYMMETLRIYASMPILGIWWKPYVFMFQCLF